MKKIKQQMIDRSGEEGGGERGGGKEGGGKKIEHKAMSL